MSIREVDSGSAVDAPEDCPIDHEILDDLRHLGDASVLHDLVSTYRLEVGRLFRDLDQALDAPDVALVASAAHSISSCSASIGATSLSAAARSIEHLARTGNLDGWEPLMTKALGDWRSTLRLLDIEVHSDSRRNGTAAPRANRVAPTWPRGAR
jgi:HPt (histidine-containing phosphotransfer) domain-containing protein